MGLGLGSSTGTGIGTGCSSDRDRDGDRGSSGHGNVLRATDMGRDTLATLPLSKWVDASDSSKHAERTC